MEFFRTEVDENYFIAEYYLKTATNLRKGAWDLSIGQSVGNPNVRNSWETDELFQNHSCVIIGNEEELKSKKQG